MPRPPKNQEGPCAIERLEEAFWEILAEKPYGKVSIGDVSRRARVNKNTLYYHYDGLRDLAERAIDNALPREFARMILAGNGLGDLCEDEIAGNADLRRRLDRVRLAAGPHGSCELAAMLKSRILRVWLGIFGIEEENLSREAELSIRFVLGGMMELLGEDRFFEGAESLPQAILRSSVMRSTAESAIALLRSEAARKRCARG